MVFVSISSSEKNELQIGKKLKKIRKNFSLLFLLKKNPEQKNYDITFSLKCSLHKPRKINETMNPIFGLSHIRAQVKKNQEFLLKKIEVFLAEKRRRDTS